MGVLDLKKNSYIKELNKFMLFNIDIPSDAVSYLNSDKSLEDFNLYNDELFVYVFKTIIEKRSIKDSFVFVKDIDFTREMFKLVCFDVCDDNQVEIFKRLLDLYIANENTFVNYESVINAFDSKEVAYDLLKFLNDYGYSNSDDVKNISLIEELVIDSKQYFMDDRSLLSFMLYTLKKMTPSFIALASEEELNKQIKIALNNAKKNAGIYDITQSDLAEISDLIDELNFSNENLENLLEKSKLEQKEIENKTELSKTKIEQQRIEQLKLFREKINNIIAQFDSDYMELVKKRNTEIDLEKDAIVSEMYTEAKKCISQLTILSNSITKNANEALKKIRSTETEATTSIESFIQNSDKVEKLFEKIKDESKLLEILEKVDTIQIPAQKTDSGIIVPNIIVPNEERVIDAVNYYLDEKIPFAKRFEELMRRKETLKEQKGYSFHEKFDDILALLIMNQNPYMIGPSGCGKSFLVDQISELLGIENVDIGYINEEYDIVGYKTADGRYSKTNFYDAYKYGSIAFGDEFDNGNAVASVKLNSFMTNKKNHSFIFPDGIRVNRHPNFRMIFAGNTTGHGATAEHNTRQKIDESVQQRQTPVYLDYDNGIERSILKEYPDWVKFIQALIQNKHMKKIDLSFIKCAISGGDSLSVSLKRKIDVFLEEHNCKIQVREGYGLTECVTGSCLTPIKKYKEGSIGVPYPDTYYKIIKPDTHTTLPYGEIGEICISGPTVMLGYLDEPKETLETLQTHEDGKTWLHTGDLGYMDEEGFIYFKQRLKRMIVSSGYNIYPQYIENVIDSYPDVLISTVIGIPHPYKGQVAKAFIVLKKDIQPSEKIKRNIIKYCEKNIAAYSMPKEFVFRDDLPKTLVGKVAYKELEKEELEKEELEKKKEN